MYFLSISGNGEAFMLSIFDESSVTLSLKRLMALMISNISVKTYSRDEQILSLFFEMQASKREQKAIPVFLPATKAQKIIDIILAVIVLIGAIWGAIYLLN